MEVQTADKDKQERALSIHREEDFMMLVLILGDTDI